MDINKKMILEEKTVKGFRYQVRKAANKFVIVKFNTKLSETDFVETLGEFNDEAKARKVFKKLL